MQTLEFNHIWNTLKSDHARRIIIINYDIIDNKDLYSRKLKALLRIEHNVNFSNFNKCLRRETYSISLILKKTIQNTDSPASDFIIFNIE
jgi:hypothetical protein